MSIGFNNIKSDTESSSLTLLISIGVTVVLLILFGVFMWRFKQRNLNNQQRAVQTLLYEPDSNENEPIEMTLLSRYKLPSYDEVVNDTHTDPPLYCEEENAVS